MTAPERVSRACTLCGRVDTHPRDIKENLTTGETQVAHFDCCAAAGCSGCRELLDSFPVSAQYGDGLIAHLNDLMKEA